MRTEVEGDFRLRNARIGGPFLAQGVSLRCSSVQNARGVALWASNSHFGADVVLQPTGHGEISSITGEVRLWGAEIAGTLFIEGTVLQATALSGVALDCYTAEIHKGVRISEHRPSRNKTLYSGSTCIPTMITGLVSFNYARVQSLELGRSSQHPRHSEGCVKLVGALLLRDIQVQGLSVFDNVDIVPCEFAVGDTMESNGAYLNSTMATRLREWHIFRNYTIVHANYANLGTRLFVYLNDHTKGPISLYGANTGTIGAQNGTDERENWAYPPDMAVLHSRQSKVRRGAPLPESFACERVLLNLDQFTYKRLNDVSKMRRDQGSRKPRETITVLRKRLRRFRYSQTWLNVLHWCMGRPRPAALYPRFDWLQHQVENPDSSQHSVTTPYLQIAKTYREMGDLRRSYEYVKERRWIQIQNRDIGGPQRFLDRLFSTFFGFGYSPSRALSTLLLLFSLSIFVEELSLLELPDLNSKVNSSERWYGFDSHVAVAALIGSRLQEQSSVRHCVGFVCDANTVAESGGCLLPTSLLDWKVFAEAGKMIVPFSRFEAGASCRLDEEAPPLVWIAHQTVLFFSWLVFPLATITFAGILREKADG